MNILLELTLFSIELSNETIESSPFEVIWSDPMEWKWNALGLVSPGPLVNSCFFFVTNEYKNYLLLQNDKKSLHYKKFTTSTITNTHQTP